MLNGDFISNTPKMITVKLKCFKMKLASATDGTQLNIMFFKENK